MTSLIFFAIGAFISTPGCVRSMCIAAMNPSGGECLAYAVSENHYLRIGPPTLPGFRQVPSPGPRIMRQGVPVAIFANIDHQNRSESALEPKPPKCVEIRRLLPGLFGKIGPEGCGVAKPAATS